MINIKLVMTSVLTIVCLCAAGDSFDPPKSAGGYSDADAILKSKLNGVLRDGTWGFNGPDDCIPAFISLGYRGKIIDLSYSDPTSSSNLLAQHIRAIIDFRAYQPWNQSSSLFTGCMNATCQRREGPFGQVVAIVHDWNVHPGVTGGQFINWGIVDPNFDSVGALDILRNGGEPAANPDLAARAVFRLEGYLNFSGIRYYRLERKNLGSAESPTWTIIAHIEDISKSPEPRPFLSRNIWGVPVQYEIIEAKDKFSAN